MTYSRKCASSYSSLCTPRQVHVARCAAQVWAEQGACALSQPLPSSSPGACLKTHASCSPEIEKITSYTAVDITETEILQDLCHDQLMNKYSYIQKYAQIKHKIQELKYMHGYTSNF